VTNDPRPVDFPFRAYVKVFAAAVFVYAFLKTASLLLLVLLAVLIATTLYPVQEWLVRKRVPRTLAFLLLAVLVIGTFLAFLLVLLPKVVDQFGALPAHFKQVSDELAGKISDESLRAKVDAAVKNPQKILGDLPAKVVEISKAIMNGVFNIGLMIVMSLYFLADGKKTYRWLRAFFAPATQAKLDETSDRVARIVAAYVAGQVITSGLVAIFVFGLLRATHVPAALSVAVLSAIFDILPMIGFLVSLAVAFALAITVSGQTALIVAAAFVGYHFLENYVIVPRIYGNRMRLSGLVVLLSLAFAVEVAGVLGGILILPIVAAYPIVEKIWLAKTLGTRTIAEHEAIEETADPKPNVD
jgi:predicted PurR-regulated permease PerM